MTRRKTMERWDTGMENCEFTPQATWPIARALLNRDVPKATNLIRGYSCLKFIT